jgi:hypothetical protein
MCSTVVGGIPPGGFEVLSLEIQAGELGLPALEEIHAEVTGGEFLQDHLEEFADAVAPLCEEIGWTPNKLESPQPEATEAVALLTMEFGEVVLEFAFDQCPIESIETGEFFTLKAFAVGARQTVIAADGSEWQISASLNIPEPGGFGFEAIGPPGADYAPYFIASNTSIVTEGLTMNSEFGDTTASFKTVFSDNIYQGEPDTEVTVTITCDT